ncbi:TolC family protein [Corallococcus praedator]|uniref:TolC family protein n=1 Tax=Corallococcus praedator TaxID=2316724 RepID=A0ABX9QPG9_9BACT|nr:MULTISPECIES: TolC family protein [Corallococcus]RKH34414.1 TolC family protein [Corallococcus sp. CA031C]RKI15534.1 TolC family protein [Corallococcus praedator]
MSIRSATAAFGLAAALLATRPAGASSPGARAAPQRLSGPLLTLEAALALARERAPALLEARAHVQAARGQVAGAAPLLRNNPQLDLQAGPRRLVTGERGMDLAVGLSQPLEIGGQQGLRRDAARAGLSREEAQVRDAERLALGEVAARFLRVLHAQERVKLADTVVVALTETVHATERRFEAGDVPVVDVNVARVARARARAEQAIARGEVTAWMGELRALLGATVPEVPGVQGDLRTLALAPLSRPGGKTLERADLTALEEEQAQARATATLGRREVLPDVTVGVRYQREADETALLGTLSVPLPVFARGQEARATAEADVGRIESMLKVARLAVSNQGSAAGERYFARVEALELLEAEALPLLTDNESLARRSYDAGELDLAGFMLIRRDALEARTEWLDSLLQTALARVQYAVELGVTP